MATLGVSTEYALCRNQDTRINCIYTVTRSMPGRVCDNQMLEETNCDASFATRGHWTVIDHTEWSGAVILFWLCAQTQRCTCLRNLRLEKLGQSPCWCNCIKLPVSVWCNCIKLPVSVWLNSELHLCVLCALSSLYRFWSNTIVLLVDANTIGEDVAQQTDRHTSWVACCVVL